LSTELRIGVTGSPVGGHVVMTAPLRASYQLKYWPPVLRSTRSSVVSVRDARDTSSRVPMMPRSRATTALHRYAPMFVVEVCTLRVPSSPRLSAGNPVRASVMAASDAQVSAA
jgi:hypothetical protein